jgi:ribosome-associated toxin RatA of RatAB toxin-antitoxin module
MPTITRSALVPYSAADMYRLVCDVESYPQFLPWCDDARIEEQTATHQLASIAISKHFEQSRFSTRNRLAANQEIRMQLIDGPFRHLVGSWRFTALDETACKVELEIDFEFSNRLLASAISPAFTRVCDSLVSAFIKRADVVFAIANRGADA